MKPLGLMIDSLIAPFAPRWAARRLAWRNHIEVLASTYGAARRDRSTKDWNPKPTSADSAILADRNLMNARARAATRDNPHAKSIERSFKRRTVGTGISPVPIVRTLDGKQEDREFNERALDLFNRWANKPKVCDKERKQSLWARQRMIASELVNVGEHFVVWSYEASRRTKSIVGLVLQSFEPEQLDLSKSRADNGNEIRAGVEVDRFGAPVAYHFLTQHPYDTIGTIDRRRSIRIPADRVFHIFEPERVRQSHGVTRLSAVLKKMRNTEGYDEATLMAARLEACMGLIIKRTTGPSSVPGLQSPSGEDGLDADNNREVNFQPGMVFEANEGEDVEPFMPTRPGGQYDAFIQAQLRAIGAGTGMGYGQVSMDFTRGTYSGQRQELLEVYAETDISQQIIIETFCEPLWEVFIRFAVIEGKLAAPGFGDDPDHYFAAEWMGPAREWIDPKNEIDAMKVALELGIATRKRILNMQGFSLQSTFAQIAEERRLAKELGIKLGGGAQEGSDERDRADVLGIAVRAGVITPSEDVEEALRSEFGLPPVNESVKAEWKRTKGVRLPITLQGDERKPRVAGAQHETEGDPNEPDETEDAESRLERLGLDRNGVLQP